MLKQLKNHGEYHVRQLLILLQLNPWHSGKSFVNEMACPFFRVIFLSISYSLHLIILPDKYTCRRCGLERLFL